VEAWAIAAVAGALVLAARDVAAAIALAVATCRVAEVEAGMPLEAVPGDSMEQAHVAAVVVAPPALDLAAAADSAEVAVAEVAVAVAEAAVAAGADRPWKTAKVQDQRYESKISK
jgi:hypothetical protein